MLNKYLLVIAVAIFGALFLAALINCGVILPKEAIFFGVPLFGFLGALAYWKT